ncbi:MAG: CRISPR-associated protein Cas4 [Nitrococcus sp.]|nr:CRISPR-associated protein Cas4 [Nitrococcus sp.]
MNEPHLVPLSALQHFAYCPRQCALIHLEQTWAENLWTAQGQVLHQRVDSQQAETRAGVRIERGVSVASDRLGLTGKLDVLEIDLATGALIPVEYKRGKPKPQHWDHIQLCAQALCLEEMRDSRIDQGAIWYWQVRRRQWVELDEALRRETEAIIGAVHKLLEGGVTPLPEPGPKCRACSLRDLCQPEANARDRSAAYVDSLYQP